LKDPVLWNIVPMCMNSLTISNSILFILKLKFIGNLPFKKIEDFENDLQIYVKLFTIPYADDTLLLAVCWRIAVGVKLFWWILWEMELKSKHKQIQSWFF
jgi:hypothetical protein